MAWHFSTHLFEEVVQTLLVSGTGDVVVWDPPQMEQGYEVVENHRVGQATSWLMTNQTLDLQRCRQAWEEW